MNVAKCQRLAIAWRTLAERIGPRTAKGKECNNVANRYYRLAGRIMARRARKLGL